MNDGNAFTLPINTTNIISGLGKCTKRGSKKCFKCDKFNGTKSLTCKSCGVVLRTAPEEKCKVNLDAVQLNTGTLRQVYSVRVRDGGPDQRGFVQLPFRGEKNGSIALSEVALCFVDSCQRLFDDSILKCHEETINSDNLFCQHIKEASKSQKMATDINIKHSTLHSLKVTDEIRMKLYVLATEKEGPLVQRVSKHVLAVKCQVSPKHPLGYLHFCFLNLKGRDVYDKYYCSCAEFKFSSNISHKCIHYFACIWAFASNEKYVEEFNTFLNHEFPVTSSKKMTYFKNNLNLFIVLESSDIIVKEISKTLPTTQSLKPKLKRKRKNKNDNKDVKKSQLLMPKIFPVHIKILNGENDGNKSVSWEYNDWLTYVTESINNSMQFENCGLLNTQVFHIPEVIFFTYYKFYFNKILLTSLVLSKWRC
ncbi:unnamed protein product [Brassicogethes aeneus]|uniref:SWIM-type domain-containing protein n=1 Tax=Brassicogethes aeneus TaxID=1431903 RepID=A0A9P0B6S4_BRAAE|nr:unnamed protein product [Brassicogethes aeneus]